MVRWRGAILSFAICIFRRSPQKRWMDIFILIGDTIYIVLGTQLKIFLAQRIQWLAHHFELSATFLNGVWSRSAVDRFERGESEA